MTREVTVTLVLRCNGKDKKGNPCNVWQKWVASSLEAAKLAALDDGWRENEEENLHLCSGRHTYEL